MRRFVPGIAVALLTVGALTACTSSASSGTSGGGSAAGMAAPAAQAASAAADSGGSTAERGAADRAIVSTGSLRLVAQRPIAVADRIQDLVRQAGGRVGRATEDPSERPSASLQLRIPSAAFTRTLDAIERQGDVRDVSIDATDVTAQVTDFTVRIANLRASIARLQDLLAEADSSNALVTIEGALTERQTSLEQLLAQQRTLADQVSFATLDVEVVTPAAAPRTGPTDFFGAVAAGAQTFAQVAAATLIGFGVALPWLAVLGAITGGALLVRRALRRRARPTSA